MGGEASKKETHVSKETQSGLKSTLSTAFTMAATFSSGFSADVLFESCANGNLFDNSEPDTFIGGFGGPDMSLFAAVDTSAARSFLRSLNITFN
jgi:hypothetical protein